MSATIPPNPNIPFFNNSYWTKGEENVNFEYANSHYLKTATSTNEFGTFYPTFVSGTGNTVVKIDDKSPTPLSYNPATGSLIATNFNGLVSLASVATTANNVNIVNSNPGTTCYPVFVDGSGNRVLNIDSLAPYPLTYNPGTGNLTANNFTGTIFTATNANNIEVLVNNTNATFYPTFVNGNGYRVMNIDNAGTPLTYVPATSTLSCSSLNASTITSSADITIDLDPSKNLIIDGVARYAGSERYIPFCPTTNVDRPPSFEFLSVRINNNNSPISQTMTLQKNVFNTTDYAVFPTVYYGYTGSAGTYNAPQSSGALNPIVISDITATDFVWNLEKGTGNNINVNIQFLVVYNIANSDYTKNWS